MASQSDQAPKDDQATFENCANKFRSEFEALQRKIASMLKKDSAFMDDMIAEMDAAIDVLRGAVENLYLVRAEADWLTYEAARCEQT
jgi:hypothetical protein